MFSSPKRCKDLVDLANFPLLTYFSYRFVDTEKWRKEFAGIGVDELVKTFDYKEKPQVFEYYPQYYHKTDKVCSTSPIYM
jgi:hypothetical protein